MNMKQKLLLAAVASVLAAPAFADDYTAGQIVDVTVPSVKLLDVKGTSGTGTAAHDASNVTTVALAKPTIAGENFVASASVDGYYDITSNIDAAGTKHRTITVAPHAALKSGWKLTITPAGTVGTAAAKSFTSADTAGVGKVVVDAIGNAVAQNVAIGYVFGPESTSVVPSYTGNGTGAGSSDTITMDYTLTDDAV